MIPVLAIPVLNRPDLLAKTVASIDHPVGTLLIIDNSPELGMGDVAEASMLAFQHLVVTEPPTNLGVAASWNLAIRSYPRDWVCLANADVEFAPGALAALDEAMAEPGLRCLVEFAAFGISPEVVDTVGWFDENFHPIYCEDSDYRYRCALAGVPIEDIPNGSTHVGSVSYRGNPHHADNARTYPANVAYYTAKWGGFIGQERYATPFGADVPLDHWRLDRGRLARGAWSGRDFVTRSAV